MQNSKVEPLLNTSVNYQETPITASQDQWNNRSSFLSNSSQKAMVLDLCKMGFDLEMIEMCFCFFTVVSIEQAVNLMTKEQDVWQHNYYEGENKKCVICKEYADHIDFKTNKNEISNNLIVLKNNNQNIDFNRISNISAHSGLNSPKDISIFVKNPKTIKEDIIIKECQVCFCELSNSLCFTPKCRHSFCIECWIYYLEEKISISEVLEITCMMINCPSKLSEENIKEILTDKQELIEKYEKFKFNKLIAVSSDKKFCPEVNCGGHVTKESNKYVICNNGHKFCFECLKKWHGKKKCEDLIDQDFEKWKKGKLLKQCPSCKFWTEKDAGCNHMTCRGCAYQWCWICEGRYTAGHYSGLGACNGLQFNNNVIYHNCLCRFFLKIGYFILYFFLGLGILIASLAFGSCALAIMLCDNQIEYLSKKIKFFIFPTVEVASLMFQPLLLVLSVIVLTLAIVCFPITYKIIKNS